MTDDMIKEHLARAHLAESVTMDAETWTEVLQELQQYRQTIHQAEQAQPVAKVQLLTTGGNAGLATRIVEIDDPLRDRLRPGQMLYTAPPQRQPLTDEQIKPLIQKAMVYYGYDNIEHWSLTSGAGFYILARAIEAAHGIKENT